ncbi:MAG: hypothetical protein QXK74_08405 [Candidatus Nitrosocaldaceae archaeon]
MKFCKNRCIVYYRIHGWGTAKEYVYCRICEVWIKKEEVGNAKRCKCCNSMFRYIYQDYSHQYRQKRAVYSLRVE